MGIIVVMILFLCGAIGAASKGDYSGIEIIGKVLLFIAVFVVLGLIVGD